MFHCYDSDADRHGDFYSSDEELGEIDEIGQIDEIENYYCRDSVNYIHEDVVKEAEHIVCSKKDPCPPCIETSEKEDYCSFCDTPSPVKHIPISGKIISNNHLHTCYNCRHTAHWTCHAGESLVDPSDVMEMTSIMCTMCKSMIENKSIDQNGSRISYLHFSKFTKHTPLVFDLTNMIEQLNAMDCGYFKNLKFRKFLDHIIQNIRAYDEFKTDKLEIELLSKIIELEDAWGKETVHKYIDKIF